MYMVKVPELNKTWKRHTNQILDSVIWDNDKGFTNFPVSNTSCIKEQKVDQLNEENLNNPTNMSVANTNITRINEVPISRPKRNVKPPVRLGY